MKQCSKCHEIKELSKFTPYKDKKDGLRNICKSCRNIEAKIIFKNYSEEKKKEYREKQNLANKKYREAHKEQTREAQKRWREKDENKDKIRKSSREWARENTLSSRLRHLRATYGLTDSEYKALLIKQNGRCAICREKKGNELQSLAVDHCHKDNKVRGLLCINCNTALGHFKDSIEILENAIKYIKESRNDCAIM